MFCTKCGNQLDPNSKFCNKCGNSINGDVNVSVPQEVHKEKVSFLKCFLQAFLTGILLYIVPYILIIIFQVFFGINLFNSFLGFIMTIGSMFMIFLGPIILYIVRVFKINKN